MKCKNVILLARSYNDLDCRLPLMHEFMRREGVTVSILIIPTTTSSGLSIKHPLPRRMGIQCDPLVVKLLPSLIGSLLRLASFMLEESNNTILKYKVWPFVWARFYRYIAMNISFRDCFIAMIEASVVIIDDILATPDRSFIVPMVAYRSSNSLLCISHGQNTYLDLWCDKQRRMVILQIRPYPLKIYVPSENDKRIISAEYPEAEVLTIGNTRFDSRWVLEFQERYIDSSEKILPYAGTKIAFMMSKMEYGLEADAVIKLVNEVAARNRTKIVLKPHTRGMTLDEFDGQLDGRVVVADKIASSEIINWADIIFFTGSSIVFEAIVKKKKVLYLAALQRYKTVFDELPSITKFKQGDDLSVAIGRLEREECDWVAMKRFLVTHTHNGLQDGQVCAAFVDNFFLNINIEA